MCRTKIFFSCQLHSYKKKELKKLSFVGSWENCLRYHTSTGRLFFIVYGTYFMATLFEPLEQWEKNGHHFNSTDTVLIKNHL